MVTYINIKAEGRDIILKLGKGKLKDFRRALRDSRVSKDSWSSFLRKVLRKKIVLDWSPSLREFY